MDSDKPYDAIKVLGQALTRLFKEESREDLLQALYLLGGAYQKVGLLWASRGSLLGAASIAAADLFSQSAVTTAQRLCFDGLRWTELRLGRIPHALAWHEVTITIKNALTQRGGDLEELREGDMEFDGTLGVLLLRTDFWELRRLEQLPDTLDSLHLRWASNALRFLLGHGSSLKHAEETDEDIESVFQKLANQPVGADLPQQPELCAAVNVTLASRILGCEIRISTPAASPCLEVSESILAAFESLMSTGLHGMRIIAHVPQLTLRVQQSTVDSEPLAFEFEYKAGVPHVDVRVGNWNVHAAPLEQQFQFRKKLGELLLTMLAHAFMVPDHESAIPALLGGERAMERAVNFTGSVLTVASVLGDHPRTSLHDWVKQDAKKYPLVRTVPWQPVLQATPDPEGNATASKAHVEAEWRSAKHTQLQVQTVIRPPLWEKAQWWATQFMTAVDEQAPPVLVPVFREGESASLIFQQWLKELGAEDPKNLLRVSIVRRTHEGRPHSYKILIGSNLDAARDNKRGQFAILMTRINEMAPQSSENLDRFLRSYDMHKSFFLQPGVANGDITKVQVATALTLRKQELHVMDAWEVGPQHVEAPAIQDDDEPIIPPERRNDAPILELMRERTKRFPRTAPGSEGKPEHVSRGGRAKGVGGKPKPSFKKRERRK